MIPSDYNPDCANRGSAWPKLGGIGQQVGEEVGKPEQLRVCYEAGPTGYALYWQLSALGVKCEVVAPTLVRVKYEARLAV